MDNIYQNNDNNKYIVCSLCNSLVDKNNIFNFKNKEVCKTCIEKHLEYKPNFSPLATFMCSLIPGCAHIFLGKRQKGIFLLASFFINIFIFVISMMFTETFYAFDIIESFFAIIAVIMPILDIYIYLYSLFDANITRKYIENNVYIEDFIDKLAHKTFNTKSKKYLQNKIIDKRLQ